MHRPRTRESGRENRSPAEQVKEDACGDSDVERVHVGADGQRDQPFHAIARGNRESIPFITDDEREPFRGTHRVDGLASRVSSPHRYVMHGTERVELVPGRGQSEMMEVSAHRATDDLGVPEVNGTWECNGRSNRKSGGSAQNGADVSGILYGVEDE